VQAFSSLNAGETVAFCRGGSFKIEGDREWVNPSCTNSSRCVVRDYPPPWSTQALPKPILTATSGDAFSFADSGDAEHEGGYTFLNLDIRSTSGGTSGNGFFVYNDVDDVLVCGVDIMGFDIGFHAAGSNPPAAGSGSDGKNARVVLRYSGLSGNGNQGYLGGCDDCGVEDSYFENNGFRQATFNHNIYFSPRGATGMFARNNYLYRSAMVGGKCEGTSLVVHGQLNGLTIEGNTIEEDIDAVGDQCWGIAVDSGYGGEAEAFRNVTIRGNTVKNVGNLGIGLNSCQGCVIENNAVIQEQAIESALIAVPDRSRESNDLALGAVKIRNNTLFARSTRPVKGIVLGGEGTGHQSLSNALLSLGSGGFTCFEYDLAHSRYGVRNNNLCYGSPTAAWTAAYPTLAAFRTASGADGASKDSNPMFTSTVEPFNFTPALGSPLINAGHPTLSAVTDINGKSRGTTPDIGAVER
jgi:parallel beta-helix repeat protein